MQADYTPEKRAERRRIRMRNGFRLIEPSIWRNNPVWQEMEAIAINGCSDALRIEIEWLKNRYVAQGHQIVRFNWVYRYFWAGTKASQQERLAELEGISEQIWHSENLIQSAIGHCRTIMDSEAMLVAARKLDDNRLVIDYDLLLGDERDMGVGRMRAIASV